MVTKKLAVPRWKYLLNVLKDKLKKYLAKRMRK